MKPLTVDDLVSLEEFVGRRGEFFEAHRRYVDRYRRVRLGPRLNLVFENRQTLWFRLQEIIRVARLTDAKHLQQQLRLSNLLLPGPDQLQATLLIDIPEENRLLKELATWQKLRGSELALCVEEQRYPATLVTCRPEDRCFGAAHWVKFDLDEQVRRFLADPAMPAYFAIDFGSYHHRSPDLSEDTRHSLLDDLRLSDSDAAA